MSSERLAMVFRRFLNQKDGLTYKNIELAVSSDTTIVEFALKAEHFPETGMEKAVEYFRRPIGVILFHDPAIPKDILKDFTEIYPSIGGVKIFDYSKTASALYPLTFEPVIIAATVDYFSGRNIRSIE